MKGEQIDREGWAVYLKYTKWPPAIDIISIPYRKPFLFSLSTVPFLHSLVRYIRFPDLSKEDIEFIFEFSERRFDTTSTIFCTLYRKEAWLKRLGGGAYAESIVECFAYNITWIDTGDVNMRQFFSHV